MEVITIDGPSASGKSTYGKLLAQKLDYFFIDSGVFYRLGTLGILKLGGPFNNELENIRKFKEVSLSFKILDDSFELLGEDVTRLLHSDKVNQLTPILAAIPQVREIVKNLQQKQVRGKNTVVAGRDIGTAIFPGARVKFFITATAQVRARRRHKQYKKNGGNLTFAQILRDTKDRDLKDTTRAASPLKVPEDAVLIDTSNLTIEQALKKMFQQCQKRGLI